jgi:putative ATP-dependent endonuclease of OLD family
VLTDLTPEALRRFRSHLRRWSASRVDFADPAPGGAENSGDEWCLPVAFLGRFSPAEDDLRPR